MLDKNAILSRKPKVKEVYIQSMDNHVYVKEFIVSERNALREQNTGADMQTLTLILGVCDEDGKPLFTTDDIKDMGDIPQIVADELLFAVVDHNERGEKDAAKN